MAEGDDDLDRDVAETPELIRTEIKRTRARLSGRLHLLTRRLLDTNTIQGKGADHTMAVEKPSKKRAHKSSETDKRKKKDDAKMEASSKKAGKSDGAKKGASGKKNGRSKSNESAKSKGSAKPKASAGKRVASKMLSKTVEVAEEMLTGAAVGAVTGAAARVQNQPAAFSGDADASARGSDSAKRTDAKTSAGAEPSEVLSEMATGAAVGAATGAAKAILHEGETAVRKSKKKK